MHAVRVRSTIRAAFSDGDMRAYRLRRTAAALYQTACDGGVLAACNRLGALYERQDAARAVALYRKACEGGDPYGCVNLGRAYWVGFGVAPNTPQAVALFQKACEGGGLPG